MHVSERTDARDRKGNALTQKFHVLDANGINQARLAVLEQPTPGDAMATWLYGFSISVDAKEIAATEGSADGNIFEVTKTFTPRPPRDEEDNEDGIAWEFSMSMTSVKQTVALDAIAAPGSRLFWDDTLGSATGKGSPIGVTIKDGKYEIEGIDIDVPVLHLKASVICTLAEWRAIKTRVEEACSEGVVNDSEFKGYAAGEVRLTSFNHADAGKNEQEVKLVQLTYGFDIQKNREFKAEGYTIPNAPGW